MYCSRSCSSKARHIKLKANGHRYKTQFSDEIILEAVQLINDGKSWAEAARETGISKDALFLRVKKMGLDVRRGAPKYLRTCNLTMPSDPVELSYLAAMVDGEGHISIEDRPGKHCVHVGITNTAVPLMQWLQTIGGTESIDQRRHHSLGKKPCSVWQIQARHDVLVFLTAILPYMKIKQDKAELAIATINRWLDVGQGGLNS